jgi:hypothetical protein
MKLPLPCAAAFFLVLPCLGNATFPASLERIESMAFADCPKLESISLPASLTQIGACAFSGDRALQLAAFHGNAPIMENDVFADHAPDFRIHYKTSATGFSTPSWLGYPAYPLLPSPLEILPIGNATIPSGSTLTFVIEASAPEGSESLSFSATGPTP